MFGSSLISCNRSIIPKILHAKSTKRKKLLWTDTTFLHYKMHYNAKYSNYFITLQRAQNKSYRKQSNHKLTKLDIFTNILQLF